MLASQIIPKVLIDPLVFLQSIAPEASKYGNGPSNFSHAKVVIDDIFLLNDLSLLSTDC